METILATTPARKSRTIQHRMDTVVWLSILPSTDSGTELLAHEFPDALSMRYGEAPPPDLPAHCDGCDAPFTLQHALACKKGGLVIFCHNKEIRDKLVILAGKAFTPTAMHDEPLIKHSRVKESEKDTLTKDTTSQEKTE